ncbi:helix-turn-helix domain-containing protein [Streptomyces sp. NPDC058733]|uniref:helix-turn-helix domain-containing protein n=1 Tax=unclassified Streptomyces TaxID=2593676 RepID=UPI003689AAFA
MLHQQPVFGAELRRLRTAAGLTLERFASSVHYSKGQLSKIENGHKRPSPEFARMCDAVLGADGALAALVPRIPHARGSKLPPDQAGAAMRRRPDPPVPFDPAAGDSTPTRRQVMAVGAVSVLAVTPAHGGAPVLPTPHRPDPGPDILAASRDLFAQFRRMGQLSPASTLLPVLAEQTRALRDLAGNCTGGTRSGLLQLSARHAEFAGWMAQESGDDEAALAWTDQAVCIAEEAGDRDLAAYALTRHALIRYYQGDAAGTISLASGALSAGLPTRIRGLAAQHVGQGHALAGDHASCLRHLDHARELLAADRPAPHTPQLGTTHVDDLITMITGWCLLDLGRPRQAAALLDKACGRLPAHALRTRARYGVRRALAHARNGEVEHACVLVRDLLPSIRAADSATIRLDLRRLSRTLARFRTVPAVSELSPDLTAALHAPLR